MKKTTKLDRKRLVVTRETIRPLRDGSQVVGGALDPDGPSMAVFETRGKTCTCDGCGSMDPVAE